MVTIDHTTPFTWTVGSASALTVSGLVVGFGGVGAVSARAPGASRASTPATKRKISPADSVLNDAVDDDRDMPGFPRFELGTARRFVTPGANTKRDDARCDRGNRPPRSGDHLRQRIDNGPKGSRRVKLWARCAT